MRAALKHLKKDPVLAGILKQVGPCTMQYRDPTFDTLVRSIVYQQLSGRVASVIFGRLLEAVRSSGDDEELTPAGIMKLRIPRMRKLGLSGQKTLYIRELAKHTRKGNIVFESLANLPDADVIAHLTQVKGIGVWTAQMFLMFALRREDVLPVADLGIRSAMKKAWNLPDLPKPPEMEQLAASWQPWRSIACWYLWRYLDGPAEL
ncbi:MAG: DNA-3-methyladenine glycosylase 2 family protein [Acidobacteriia bacterium]|nr:DNA-3-methyladenine glycosylase 2 family protein [Terriglobia bacterium]